MIFTFSSPTYFRALAQQKQEQNSHKYAIYRYLYKLLQEFLGRIRGYGVGPKENTALRHIYARERPHQRPRRPRFCILSAHSPHWKDKKRPPDALDGIGIWQAVQSGCLGWLRSCRGFLKDSP